MPIGMVRQQLGHPGAESAVAHIGERFGVDHIIGVAGAQQIEEVVPALRTGRSEPGEMVVADMGAKAVLCLVACAGIVDPQPGRTAQARAQYVAALVEKSVLPGGQQPHHLPLRDRDAGGRTCYAEMGRLAQ